MILTEIIEIVINLKCAAEWMNEQILASSSWYPVEKYFPFHLFLM